MPQIAVFNTVLGETFEQHYSHYYMLREKTKRYQRKLRARFVSNHICVFVALL